MWFIKKKTIHPHLLRHYTQSTYLVIFLEVLPKKCGQCGEHVKLCILELKMNCFSCFQPKAHSVAHAKL